MINPEEIVCPKQVGLYTFGNVIGYGSFAVVRTATKIGSEMLYACKIVPRDRIANPELELRFEQEIRVLQQMKHPNITQLYDLIKDTSNFYIFMEYCPRGELFQLIINRKNLSEDEAKIYLAQLCDALRHVHNLGACHRDLKPENLLLGNNGELKITDFGFSRFERTNELCKTACGSPCYVSPECLGEAPYVGSKSDIWSAGVIFYVMCSGKLPWTKKNQAQLFDQIKKGEYNVPNNISNEGKALIRKMVCVDPEKRITADEVLKEPYMKDAVSHLLKNTMELGVTLKKLDKFFERDTSSGAFQDMDILLGNCISSREQGFSSIRKLIRPVTPPKNAPSKLPPLLKPRKTQTFMSSSASLPKRRRTQSQFRKSLH